MRQSGLFALFAIIIAFQATGQLDTVEPMVIEGAIKLGESRDTTPEAGTLRWNPITGNFEGFTGNEWVSLMTYGKTYGVYQLTSAEHENLIPMDADTNDSFGYTGVAICGEYAIAGSYGDSDNGVGSGSAYIFKRSGNDWVEQAKLTASDGDAHDSFGSSVSIHDDYAIVGANGDNGNSGSAYIFKRSGNDWVEQAKLTASDAGAGDKFGERVAMHGKFAIIGAWANDDAGSNSGSAYIFHRTGSDWNEQEKLTASDADEEDYFGFSVSISGDFALVGARNDDEVGQNAGSAYIFQRNGSNWLEEAKLTASDGASYDGFGRSVSISGDYVLIGAWQDDDRGQNSGSAYIFHRSGSNWTEQTKITASNGSSFDWFGSSVSLSGDYAIVGAPNASEGAAYIFHRTGTNWIQQAQLVASDGQASDSFGNWVDISGNYAVVSSLEGGDLPFIGSIYIFE